MLTVPFPYHVLPHAGNFLGPFFEPLNRWTGDHVFGISHPYTAAIMSDSTGMYIHVFVLAVFSLLAAGVWKLLGKKERNYERLQYWFHVLLSYYLSLQLFKYGFSKIFKNQFYLPEPNTLFTPFGDLSDDILYWSTMGSSYSYSVFTGILEVIPAILLLFRKTRSAGAVLASAVMLHVVMINFCFDISVKVFSVFLFLISLVIAFPGIRKLFRILIKKETGDQPRWIPRIQNKKQALLYSLAKALVIALILYETLLLYFLAGNFNDDKSPRPPFHGAYDVKVFVIDNDTLPPLLTDSMRFRRVFIHRQGYFIVQKMNDAMTDFKMDYVPGDNMISLTEGNKIKAQFEITETENGRYLYFEGKYEGTEMKIRAKKIDLSKLPALQKGFHWTIDDYK
ncbi:MAG: hypothetical protein FD123_4256 [Bacteroidetes bacterium]|nr:MAG: hypothetical protein FD123_4256 [Bacteroidota bacterium]